MSQEETTVKINTAKFGEVEVNKDAIFNFVSPIIGLKT